MSHLDWATLDAMLVGSPSLGLVSILAKGNGAFVTSRITLFTQDSSQTRKRHSVIVERKER